jgi:hypothetical protein
MKSEEWKNMAGKTARTSHFSVVLPGTAFF